jgi:hypothetical protein
MLGDLGAAPNLVRQDFPYEPEIYPFPFNLEPLSRESLAKYVYAEAPANKLDRDDPANADPAYQAFLDQLDAALPGGLRLNHIGSLYGKIIKLTKRIITAGTPGIADLSHWPVTLENIRGEGERDHFEFFRAVFLGTHDAFAGVADPWGLPATDPNYPSVDIGTNRSALEGHPNPIPENGNGRKIARLSNLHYWLVLGLLDLGYRTANATVSGRAKMHMIVAVAKLGEHLAALRGGLPFDPLSAGYALGKDTVSSARILRALAVEAGALAEELRADLPAGFSFTLPTQTATALDAIIGGPAGGQGGEPPTGEPGQPAEIPDAAVAMEFWFEFDNTFVPQSAPPEVMAAYAQIGDLDLPMTQFNETRQLRTYPAAFVTAVTPIKPGLQALSGLQLAVLDRHFAGDLAKLQSAFEHFGCGDLFDERRPADNRVHMMDSSGPANPPIGYHRWHTIIRAMTVLDIDADRWNAIDRLVALAWAIHAESQPRQDTRNPAPPQARLTALRTHWLALSPDKLDDAFDAFPFPPPAP